MKKPIVIISGEPNSIFYEILIKAFKKYRNKRPIILIGSQKLIYAQLKKLKLKFNFNIITNDFSKLKKLKNKSINLLNIEYKFTKPFEKISSKSNSYINQCFYQALRINESFKIIGIINGPISKKHFLKNKFPGITEFLANKFKVKDDYCMLIYNKSLSVCPLTTHLPVNRISKSIKKKLIINKILLISNFFKRNFYKKPKIALLGLNPHCENFFNTSEEKKVIEPAIKLLKKKQVKIFGPYPADTIFLKQNSKKFNVIIGMYHDQVLTPIKALHGFNAINITLGLPFLRISPDHGPNNKMVGKNKSDPQSLINAIKFLNRNL